MRVQYASMNIIEFEETLVNWRFEKYYHPKIDIIGEGFRPVSGSVADFCVTQLDGTYHFFYIERRLAEGTPFYPGNEIYFGHASTPDFFTWEVHDPVMLIQPGTWEEAHVWAPFILKRGATYVMAYTGLNRHISQDIGLAFSEDLFEWRRWEGNPISPCKDRPWSFWRTDGIASCRDPHMLEYKGRVWMTYTTNTHDGRACVAMTSSEDLVTWRDHGPILVGPEGGYEPVFAGGHKQASEESTNLQHRNGKWYLIVNTAMRHTPIRHWIIESDRIDSFSFDSGWEFWPDGGCTEVVKDRGDRSLMAAVGGGRIIFGEVDWSAERPTVTRVSNAEQLKAW